MLSFHFTLQELSENTIFWQFLIEFCYQKSVFNLLSPVHKKIFFQLFYFSHFLISLEGSRSERLNQSTKLVFYHGPDYLILHHRGNITFPLIVNTQYQGNIKVIKNLALGYISIWHFEFGTQTQCILKDPKVKTKKQFSLFSLSWTKNSGFSKRGDGRSNPSIIPLIHHWFAYSAFQI